MKKLLIQPCVLMVASLGLLLTACGETENGPVKVLGKPTVSIEFVGTPGVSDVTVKFVPTEETAKFNYAIGSEQDRENFENGDIVGMQTETSNQEITHTWNELEAGEYYVVYAMAYDEDGAAGPVSAHGFKTASSDFVVETYYIGDNSAAFRITNTNDYYTYKYALGTAADKEAFLNMTARKTYEPEITMMSRNRNAGTGLRTISTLSPLPSMYSTASVRTAAAAIPSSSKFRSPPMQRAATRYRTSYIRRVPRTSTCRTIP